MIKLSALVFELRHNRNAGALVDDSHDWLPNMDIEAQSTMSKINAQRKNAGIDPHRTLL